MTKSKNSFLCFCRFDDCNFMCYVMFQEKSVFTRIYNSIETVCIIFPTQNEFLVSLSENKKLSTTKEQCLSCSWTRDRDFRSITDIIKKTLNRVLRPFLASVFLSLSVKIVTWKYRHSLFVGQVFIPSSVPNIGWHKH